MTAAGVVFMTISLGFVLGLCVFCYSRVLSTSGRPDSSHPANTDDDEP